MTGRITGLRPNTAVPLGPSDWLVDGMAEKVALVRSRGWSAAHIWTAQEVLSLPWPAPPTVKDVVRAFSGHVARPATVPPEDQAADGHQ